MIRTLLATVALGLCMTGAASAASVIFSDNFDTEALGAPQNSLANWTVTSGTVDVIGATGFYDFYPGNGRYLDMNGTPGQGRIDTASLLSGAPTRVTLSFDYGNNKNSNGNEVLSFGIGDQSWSIPINGAVPTLIHYSLTFLFDGGASNLFFADTGSQSPGDNGGPILDNVQLASVPLPAGGLLLLGAMGGLAALRRRKSV